HSRDLPSLPSFPTRRSSDLIFTSDLDGDGSLAGNTSGQSGDLLTGTGIGSFGRDIGVTGLASLISQWNSSGAGKLTPAGQALVEDRKSTRLNSSHVAISYAV